MSLQNTPAGGPRTSNWYDSPFRDEHAPEAESLRPDEWFGTGPAAAFEAESPFLPAAAEAEHEAGGGLASEDELELERPPAGFGGGPGDITYAQAAGEWGEAEGEASTGYDSAAAPVWELDQPQPPTARRADDAAIYALVGEYIGEKEGAITAPVVSLALGAVLAAELRRGNRDENALTQRLFDARHPARKGQALPPQGRRTAAEQRLVDEWLELRQRIVQPVLLSGPAVGPIHTAGPVPASLRRGVPADAVLSPLAITLRGLRRAPQRMAAVKQIVVHTTSRGPANRSIKARYSKPAIEYALNYYIGGDGGFPHYVVDFNGTVYATCDERYSAHHAGWVHPGGKNLFRQSSWTPPQWWSRVWSAYRARTPIDLLPAGASSPNSRSIGIELLILPGLRYTAAQYAALARLIGDIERRHGLNIPAAPSPALLGHEDYAPVAGEGGRADARGGWDPGAHRDKPYFHWSRVWSALRGGSSASGTAAADRPTVTRDFESPFDGEHPARAPAPAFESESPFAPETGGEHEGGREGEYEDAEAMAPSDEAFYGEAEEPAAEYHVEEEGTADDAGGDVAAGSEFDAESLAESEVGAAVESEAEGEAEAWPAEAETEAEDFVDAGYETAPTSEAEWSPHAEVGPAGPLPFDAERPEPEEEFDAEAGLLAVPADSWVVSPEVRAAGESQAVPYDDAPAWDPAGRNCTGSFTAGGQELRRYLLANFRGIDSIGGYSCRQNTASPTKMSVHGTGRALDIMIRPVGGKGNSAVGDPVAGWLVLSASAIGVQYLIWNRVQWSGRRSQFAPYGGPNPHIDHIHVELTSAAGRRETPWFRNRANAPHSPPAGSAPPAPPAAGSVAQDAIDTVRDTTALAAAMARGVRDEAGLTNAIFFARHPQRNGAPIRPDERSLAGEWVTIRDRIVRPWMRKHAAPAPAGSPVGGPGPKAPASPPRAADDVIVRRHVLKGTDRERKLDLEAGVSVRYTRPFTPDRNRPFDIVLACTGAAEGGYDSVNIYDKGILSWGVMQWTFHAGSLQKALAFMKGRLGTGRWSALFPGLDVNDKAQLVVRGEVILPNSADRHRRLREVFRGRPSPGDYDVSIASHWARVFARAGRDPEVQRLQGEYGGREVQAMLGMNLGAYLAARRRDCDKAAVRAKWGYVCPRLLNAPAATYRSRYPYGVGQYLGDNLKSIALVFGMRTNNPAAAMVHLKQAVDEVMATPAGTGLGQRGSGTDASLAEALVRVFSQSTFSVWPSRTAKILAELKRLTGT